MSYNKNTSVYPITDLNTGCIIDNSNAHFVHDKLYSNGLTPREAAKIYGRSMGPQKEDFYGSQSILRAGYNTLALASATAVGLSAIDVIDNPIALGFGIGGLIGSYFLKRKHVSRDLDQQIIEETVQGMLISEKLKSIQ